jgi:hypothetical protein
VRPKPFEAPVMKTYLPLKSALTESIAGYVSWWIVEVNLNPVSDQLIEHNGGGVGNDLG